jgi:hypothetical protein
MLVYAIHGLDTQLCLPLVRKVKGLVWVVVVVVNYSQSPSVNYQIA